MSTITRPPLPFPASRSRGRRRRDVEPPIRTVVKGLAVSAVVGVLIWLAVSAYNGIPFTNYSTLYVSIPAAGNLLPHDPVRIAGVRVGQVLSKSLGSNGRVRLSLQLEPGVTVPADTAVAVRAQGLLGARYVDLVLGHSAHALPSGSTLTASTSALTFGVPEALDTFDAQTRGALGAMVRGLGAGFLGRGRGLNDALRLDAPQMVPFQQLAATILARPGAAQRLLPSLDRMTTALAGSGAQIAGTFTPGAAALAPFVTERGALRATLDQAPAALESATTGLTQGTRLLGATEALATALHGTLPDAPAGLRRLTSLLKTSPQPLDRAAALLGTAQQAVPAALQITGSLQPVLAPLSQGLARLTPMLDQIAPYGCNVENLGAVFRSMTGLGGTGTGPHGPAMAFRLTPVPPGGQGFFGSTDTSGLTQRDGYPAPCHYLASTYPAIGVHAK